MSGRAPKISIITPSFNQGEYIEETILSVINQDYDNLEFIITDGGSTDQTVEIIKKYEAKISYWISEPDKGQTDAIVKGFKKSKGDIITWLNSDDVLEPNALHTMANTFIENPDKFFIYGLNTDFDEAGNSELRIFPVDKLHLRGVYDFPYSQPACFYKREVLEKIGYPDVKIHFAMDHDFFLRIILNFPYLSISEKITRQRIHENTKTSNLIEVCREDTKLIVRNFLYSIRKSEAKENCTSLLIDLLPINAKPKVYPISVLYSELEIYIIVYEHLMWYAGQWYNKGEFEKLKKFFIFFERNLSQDYIQSSGLSKIYFRYRFLPPSFIKLSRKLIS